MRTVSRRVCGLRVDGAYRVMARMLSDTLDGGVGRVCLLLCVPPRGLREVRGDGACVEGLARWFAMILRGRGFTVERYGRYVAKPGQIVSAGSAAGSAAGLEDGAAAGLVDGAGLEDGAAAGSAAGSAADLTGCPFHGTNRAHFFIIMASRKNGY